MAGPGRVPNAIPIAIPFPSMASFQSRFAPLLIGAVMAGAVAGSKPPAADDLQAVKEREVQPLSLCAPDERVVFNCSTGNKLASVCISIRSNPKRQIRLSL